MMMMKLQTLLPDDDDETERQRKDFLQRILNVVLRVLARFIAIR